MMPFNIIQALFKSGAIQTFHSSSTLSDSEVKLANPSIKILDKLLVTNSEMTELTFKNRQSLPKDTIELTTSESNRFLQEQVSFKTADLEYISLRISGRKKKGKIDPTFCQLLFSLNLTNLNEVLIDVRVQNRLVSIKIYNQTVGVESLANDLKSSIKTSLESLGYQLSSVSVDNLAINEVMKDQADLCNSTNKVDIKI